MRYPGRSVRDALAVPDESWFIRVFAKQFRVGTGTVQRIAAEPLA